jgi:hypothetical protein
VEQNAGPVSDESQRSTVEQNAGPVSDDSQRSTVEQNAGPVSDESQRSTVEQNAGPVSDELVFALSCIRHRRQHALRYPQKGLPNKISIWL